LALACNSTRTYLSLSLPTSLPLSALTGINITAADDGLVDGDGGGGDDNNSDNNSDSLGPDAVR